MSDPKLLPKLLMPRPGASGRLPAGALTVLMMAGLTACGDEPADLPTATASSQELVTLVGVSGAGQCAAPNSPLGEAFTVMAVDDEDRPVSGITIDWQVTRGGGDLSALWSVTDDRGRAAVKYALGPWVQTNVVRASVRASGPSVTPIAFFSHARQDDGSGRIIFDQAVPDPRPDDQGMFHHSRYLLYPDSTFEFRRESEAGETNVYEGRYSRSDSLITFDFYWGRPTGVIDGTRLTVELSPGAQLSDYPGGGDYVLCSTR